MTSGPADAHDPDRSHYSYAVYADPAMAGKFDRMRFSGPIGTLVAESQERVLLDFAGDLTGRSVLDVGTGTGRAALSMARRGARVVGVDASAEMLETARARAADERVEVAFEVADAHHLPFEDDSFDVTVSLRVIMHTPDWRQCVAELCRVSRCRVIFDYPALASVASIQAGARRLLALVGRPTEAYRVFGHRAIEAELVRCGWALTRRHRQFVLPIALHKAIGSRRFTEDRSVVLGGLGLSRLFGSPVTVVAEPAGARPRGGR